MEERSAYTVNIQLRTLSYHPGGCTTSAVQLHSHHFDTFDASFALLMSLDESYFSERLAVKRNSAICIDAVDIHHAGTSKHGEPTLISAVNGGDSPLLNEAPGLYYILWTGAGRLAADYGLCMQAFKSYSPLHMVLPVAHFEAESNTVHKDPAYEQLKHRYLQQYLSEKRYCLSILSFATNLNITGEENFCGRMKEVWHFNTVEQALSVFKNFDVQLLDAGFCCVKNESRYYESVHLYEERGENLLSLNTNRYENSDTEPKTCGMYLHFNADTALGHYLNDHLAVNLQDCSFLAAKYDKDSVYAGTTAEWEKCKSLLSDFTQNRDRGKQRIRSLMPTAQQQKKGVQP